MGRVGGIDDTTQMKYGRSLASLAVAAQLTAAALSAQAQDPNAPGSPNAYYKMLTKQITPQQQVELAGYVIKLQQNPDDVDSLIRTGVLFMEVARAHRNNHIVWLMCAVKELSRAARLEPNNFYAHHNYGQALYMAGDIRPQFRSFFALFDSRYNGQPNMQISVQEFTKAIEINPQSARSYMGRGFAYYVLGDPTHGQPDLDKAIALDPSLRSGIADELKGIAAMKGKAEQDWAGTEEMLRQMSTYSIIAGVTNKKDCDAHDGAWMEGQCRTRTILP
jgi:tetratricopeptide (TPR) repeat protein